MKNLILIQLIIYLLICPMTLMYLDTSLNYRIDISIVFISTFIFGALSARRSIKFSETQYIPTFSKSLQIGLILLSILYILITLSHGLENRRQGSEYMAYLFSRIAFIDLLVIRIYEIIFYPILIIFLMKNNGFKTFFSISFIFLTLICFLLSGALDSKANLILPCLYYYVFIMGSNLNKQPISSKFIKLAILGITLLVISVLLSRLKTYNDLQMYIVHEFLNRLNGIELITLVDNKIQIPFIGTWDLNIFNNLIANIPFLEEAKVLKEQGLTSSKGYYLNNILGFQAIDFNNSLVTDLFYFGGYALLAIGGFILGHLSKKTDWMIASGKIWASKLNAALIFSFVLNALTIEKEVSSLLITFPRNFLIIYSLFLFIDLKLVKKSYTDLKL